MARNGLNLEVKGVTEKNPPPLDLLLSESYWQKHAQALTTDRATAFTPPGPSAAEGQETTHFVVADRAGNVVSATITLGYADSRF